MEILLSDEQDKLNLAAKKGDTNEYKGLLTQLGIIGLDRNKYLAQYFDIQAEVYIEKNDARMAKQCSSVAGKIRDLVVPMNELDPGQVIDLFR